MKTPALSLVYSNEIEDPFRAEIIFQFGSNEKGRVYFQTENHALRRSGDVLLCLGLLPAMELGADLSIEVPVTEELLLNAKKIQTLLCAWNPDYKTINIHADSCKSEYSKNRGSGVFYSGGIDSSYSLTVEQDHLNTLVTVLGIDGLPPSSSGSNSLRNTANQVASHYGIEPIIVETDIRKISDHLIGWEEYHGALLSAIRHLLADQLAKQLIASSGDETSFQRPWGSHPDLDPLFGTSEVEIRHHGLVTRAVKFEVLLNEPVLLGNLRVCNKTEHGNCGKCDKCTFVLHALDTYQGFEFAPGFRPVDLGKGPIVISGPSHLSDWVSLRDAAQLHGNASQLVAGIDKAVSIYRNKKPAIRIRSVKGFKKRFKRFKRKLRYILYARSRNTVRSGD